MKRFDSVSCPLSELSQRIATPRVSRLVQELEEMKRDIDRDGLVDRDCVILDGHCNCEKIQGVLNCKYNTF